MKHKSIEERLDTLRKDLKKNKEASKNEIIKDIVEDTRYVYQDKKDLLKFQGLTDDMIIDLIDIDKCHDFIFKEPEGNQTYKNYNLDRGGGFERVFKKVSKDVYSEDFVNDLFADPNFHEKEQKDDLQKVIRLIKRLEKFIAEHPSVISGFKDALTLIRQQYAEVIAKAKGMKVNVSGDLIFDTARKARLNHQVDVGINKLIENLTDLYRIYFKK